MTTSIAILLALTALLLLLLVRNNFVLDSRLGILDVEPIDTGLQLYARLPSYDAMLLNPMYWLLWTPRHWLSWINRREANHA